ncbi:MAG TPA: dTMP kinase [Bryobacteraceae bacterium]|nr:dTMP kinase [Bryobacteraceae bacterium]
MTERKGAFITFEGPDGSGKSTQMRLLAERLRERGRDVVETQEPGGTQIGLQIRSILLNAENRKLCPVAEMLLYFAARAQNFDERILPAWEEGAIVLSDRFTDSTLAYQGGGRELGHDVVMQLHNIACHGLQPDLTICIDVDTEVGLQRVRTRGGGGRDRIEEEAVAFHERVRQIYLELGQKFPERIKIIDGNGSVEDVAKRVWRVVEPRV